MLYLFGLIILEMGSEISSLYEVLGVPVDATQEEIKLAYKRQAKRVHADVGGSHEAMVKLNAAYKILSDPELRTKYDQTGNAEEGMSFEVRFRAFAGDVFLKNLEYLDVKTTDIIKVFIEETIRIKQECITTKTAFQSKIDKNNEVIDRIGNESHALVPVLLGNNEVHKQNILRLDADIVFLEQCEYLLSECNYRVDTKAEADTTQGAWNWRIG